MALLCFFRHGENRHITGLQASSALDRLARLDSEVQVQVQSAETRMKRSEKSELDGQIISSQEETFTKYNLSSNIKEYKCFIYLLSFALLFSFSLSPYSFIKLSIYVFNV